MDIMLKKLITILDKTIEFYQKLLGVMECEKQAMVSWNMKDILDCSKRKNMFLSRIQACEEERIVCTGKIADILNLPKDVSISALIPEVSDVFRGKLRDNREVLLGLIHKVKYKNRFNSRLALKTSMFLNEFMGRMTKDILPTNTYSKDGRMTGNTSSHIFNKNL